MASTADFEKLGVFYLGKVYDLNTRKRTEEMVLYDSKDMVTHGVCVGMTGSGKTGLCIGLLEEAAIDNIPALVIDPKGDLSNLLLTFPNLSPEEFAPWVNLEDGARKGIPAKDYPAQQAKTWTGGLAQWGQDGARIQRLRDSADFTIYTPGSTAGVPVSILKSFGAPGEAIINDREQFRDRVAATATALLSLVGIDIDPLQSREHILVSSILDTAWRDGKDVDLGAMIQQIQTPPFARIGVLDLESFYPSKERFKLAMALNNLLASPGFEVWLEGDPLDVGSLLYTAQGKPRISIFSIAHLSDTERMFFVSLLLNQTLSWIRTQPGTTSLRALLYMDEIFGYFPPVANPPSKKPLLTLLKQSRAFGLGILLATQNPVDLDYKGLANCGTWFIGRLQTDRDKQRVLDGLEGAAATSGGRFDRDEMDRVLSGLGSRVFLINNVHDNGPEIFETRWCLSYLRGPMTRQQIKLLMDGKKAAQPAAPSTAKPVLNRAAARPVLPPGVEDKFIPARGTLSGLVYEPVLFGAATVRFVDTKAGVDETREVAFAAPFLDGAIPVNWEEAAEADCEAADLEMEPVEGAGFAELPAPAAQAKNYKLWSKDFANWLFANQTYELFYCASQNVTSEAGESERDFRIRMQQLSHERRDTDVEAVRQRYASKIGAIDDKIFKAEQTLEKEKQQSRSSKLESALSIGVNVLGAILGGGRKLSGITQGARAIGRTVREGQDVDRHEESVERLKADKAEIEAQMQQEFEAVKQGPDPASEEFSKVQVRPKKTNISVRLLTLAWKP
ncbi:MAG: ATP-binding protein [Acidobacteria bacterium]|nr:ATP-binding protein [Acidobacteriota bacterium]